ncbi:MAG TPA: TIGR03086 family metal-binding protein [Actinophytocola sp.]|uniref:TIGR03086 family metal-binding protein n=1 Tax=Actinophytocola sp. TaxID=1872138 RepID=UPI002DBA66A6|nr:TIGR03086 family metal-binding protein [Actinophytocola sp.]HEU5469125.1 TIGR03086 family metal-binding protein [Actinophytocola sp.]
MDIRALDRRALAGTGRIVAQVDAVRLAAPTPCAEWDLRALLVHMAGNNNGFARAAAGHPAEEAVWRGDGLDGDPVAAYQESAQRVEAAFAADGVLDRSLAVYGFGTFPANTAIGMHFIDYLVHGWDVARAIGVEPDLEPELCDAVLKIGAGWPKGSPAIWGPGAPFGHPVPVRNDAPVAERMLGFLGRSASPSDQEGGDWMRGVGDGSERE